ncbi:MAG: hypothetical protein ACR2MD_05885 [Aridibacter sp.]
MKIKLLTAIVALFLFAGISFAQNTDKKMKDMDMKMGDKLEMAEMMKSQNHQVMSVYRKNLLNFAETLRDIAKDSDNFNPEFAKAVFSDINRSSEMMDMVHQDHMGKMDSKMVEKMKEKKAELDHHIMALGKEINADSVNAKEVEKHASAIAELLREKKMDTMEKGKMHDGMKH